MGFSVVFSLMVRRKSMRRCTCERGVRRNEMSCVCAVACMACGFHCHMSQPREALSYLMVKRPPLEASRRTPSCTLGLLPAYRFLLGSNLHSDKSAPQVSQNDFGGEMGDATFAFVPDISAFSPKLFLPPRPSSHFSLFFECSPPCWPPRRLLLPTCAPLRTCAQT